MDEETKAINELRIHYRNVFSSSSGAVVWQDLLCRGGFFDSDLHHDNPEDLGRHNFIMEIVEILGAYSVNSERVSEAVADAVLEALIQQPLCNIE